jgi:hypothetical protein
MFVANFFAKVSKNVYLSGIFLFLLYSISVHPAVRFPAASH